MNRAEDFAFRAVPKTRCDRGDRICTVALPTKTGQTLRIRKAATPEKDVAELYQLLRIPDQVINPMARWTASPASD